MGWCEEVLGLDPAIPAHQQMRGMGTRMAALPLADLVRGWREVAHAALLDQSPGISAFVFYFDRMAYDDPHRTVAFLEQAAQSEPDDDVLALMGEQKLLSQLLVFHAEEIVGELEAAALRTPRLTWLLGSVRGTVARTKPEPVKERLGAICDADGFHAFLAERKARSQPMDLLALDLPALAKAWIDINQWTNLRRSQDDTATNLFDLQWEWANRDPERALALAMEIARSTDDEALLCLLGAGLLEDILPAQETPLLELILKEAEANASFRFALSNAYLSDVSPAVAERVGEACG